MTDAEGNLTGQAQGQWSEWRPAFNHGMGQHFVRHQDNGPLNRTEQTMSLDEAAARLSQAQEENERLRTSLDVYDVLLDGAADEYKVALEAARIAETKAALADEANRAWLAGEDERPTLRALSRGIAALTPAADAAEEAT
jgi:hypothetical protein